MRQLTSLDSQFLALETRRQTGDLGSVAILDPSTTPSGTLTIADIEALITERLPLLPPLRWRLREVPLGLDYPYDDADFDLHFHVRELGLAVPGTDEQLAEQVARIVSRPPDRAHPLWELYVISGLQSGHVAMLTKIHLAVIEGLSGAEIMGLLLDLSPEIRKIEPDGSWGDNETRPGDLGMLARGVAGAARYPLRALTALPPALPNLEETQFKPIPGSASVITHGMGLNITVMSYIGHLDFGVVADSEQMPDVALLMGWLADELELLMPGKAPAPRRKHKPAAKRARRRPAKQP